ncbi:MAG: hypothetical protein HYW24_02535 [Candidatus Aenigmarchaeota archaeon]|nr:hypothetical protein [Candidatus Aenigmarchaeota archaeon]
MLFLPFRHEKEYQLPLFDVSKYRGRYTGNFGEKLQRRYETERRIVSYRELAIVGASMGTFVTLIGLIPSELREGLLKQPYIVGMNIFGLAIAFPALAYLVDEITDFYHLGSQKLSSLRQHSKTE